MDRDNPLGERSYFGPRAFPKQKLPQWQFRRGAARSAHPSCHNFNVFLSSPPKYYISGPRRVEDIFIASHERRQVKVREQMRAELYRSDKARLFRSKSQ
jgi:hypothetical protein